mgnify:CR=1 FL=1
MNTNDLSTLRKHITPFYGDHLPEQIRYRDRAGDNAPTCIIQYLPADAE